MGRSLALVGALALTLAVAAPAAAAPKSGCSAEASLWERSSIEAANDTIWPALLDPSAIPDGEAGLEELIANYDRNDDGDICLLTMWGENLNPKSHWYLVGLEVLGSPTQQFLLRDNTANGSA